MSTGSGYDFSASTFSPDGRIFQVEYAQKAVDGASTVIGVRCKDGVVMGVEKMLVSKMLVEGTNRMLHSCDEHLALGATGIGPDGRQLMNRARLEARNYKKDFGVACPPEVLADRMAQFVHYYTMSGALRPFGASCLIAGYDEDLKDHQLYQIDPNGVVFRFFGCAIGKGRQLAKTEIEKNKLFDMTCKEVINWITKILHVIHDDVKDKPFELELSWICEESKWKHVMVPKELREGAKEWAKAKIEEDDMEDDDDDDDDDE